MSDPNLARSFARLSVATIPTIVGDYVLHKKLGDGSRGVVKLANNTTKNETVACKIIRKEDLSEETRQKVMEEIELTQRIQHPNVIKFIQLIEVESTINIFLEYAAGGSLKEFLRARSKLKEKEASVLFHQIVDGVSAIHESGIIHRNLKPSNILLAADLEVKISDFTLAKKYEESQTINEFFPVNSYSAPEIVHQTPYVGPELDIWSIGVILYEMLAGHHPFEDDSISEESPSVSETSGPRESLHNTDSFPHFFSDLIQDLLRKILQTQPEKRLTLTQIKDHPWLTMYSSPKLLLVSRSEPLNVLETRALVRPRRFSRINSYLGRVFRTSTNS